jgi:hypothetical protein
MKIIADIIIHLNQRPSKPTLVNLLHHDHHYHHLLLHLLLKALRTFILHIDLHHLCKHQRMANVDRLKISISKRKKEKGWSM